MSSKTDANKGKCLKCGYVCIEKNKEVEKKIHEDVGHPFKGDKVKWV